MKLATVFGVAVGLRALAAFGLFAWEIVFGVVFAGIAGASGSPTPLEVIAPHAYAIPLGMLVFAGAIAWLYTATKRAAQA